MCYKSGSPSVDKALPTTRLKWSPLCCATEGQRYLSLSCCDTQRAVSAHSFDSAVAAGVLHYQWFVASFVCCETPPSSCDTQRAVSARGLRLCGGRFRKQRRLCWCSRFAVLPSAATCRCPADLHMLLHYRRWPACGSVLRRRHLPNDAPCHPCAPPRWPWGCAPCASCRPVAFGASSGGACAAATCGIRPGALGEVPRRFAARD